MLKLVHSASQSLKIFNSHPKTDVFYFTNVSRYIKVCYSNMNPKNRIHHSYVYSQIHANELKIYHSGDVTFSLFDFGEQKDE